MVVDDSAVIRGLISRMLEAEADISVAASVGDGQMALNSIGRHDIDIVLLDIEMPVMDGLTALPKLLAAKPDVRIIMASTLTLRNAEISMRALEAGASDYVPKPSTSRELSGGSDFKRELIEKVRNLATARREKLGGARPAPAARPAAAPKPAAPAARKPVTLREPGTAKPSVLAIGSSTGGPQALFDFFKGLDRTKLNIPVVLTQHMPATFTTILAEHITRMSGWPCAEATDGAPLKAGEVMLAPGGFHMIVEKSGVGQVVRLNQDPPENFCRPAVDPMLRSVVKAFGGHTIVAILTGMGSDGMKGAKEVIDAGGTVVAQDEATSVVWGMPGAVAEAGLCAAVLPIKELAGYVMKIAGRGA
jgi:two-component system chemotaxis response regulator CheB